MNTQETDDSVRIRIENSENAEERAAIRAVNQQAFGGTEESALVDKLRDDEHALISLVAELVRRQDDVSVVGHILFSRMWIQTPAALVPAVALAPVAVLPPYQRRGIGSRLIRAGLKSVRDQGEKIVIVVGHPEYYPRFGFSTEAARSLTSPFPPEAFMALELSAGALADVQGSVVYPPAFGI